MLQKLATILLVGTALGIHAFAPSSPSFARDTVVLASQRARVQAQRVEHHFLLQEFRTADGEVINPYKILGISRNAGPLEIKRAYRDQSRRYHPDQVRHRDILPGKCNNLDDVRDEWERVKLSYEILSDKKTKMKFDRHEAIADPGQAMRRAALGMAGKAIAGIGSGMWAMGALAVEKLNNEK